MLATTTDPDGRTVVLLRRSTGAERPLPQFDGDGTLIAITIVNARRILEREGKIPITLPSHRIEATDLGAVLTPA